MRIEGLKYLIDFAEAGSVSAAASKNFISEQGMSRILHSIESEYGVSIFYREGKMLKLTEAGVELVEGVREVVEGYHKVENLMSYYSNEMHAGLENVEIYSTPCASLCLLPHIDALMPGLFPFKVRLREEGLDTFGEIARRILAGEGVGMVSVPPIGSGEKYFEKFGSGELQFIELLDSEVVALVSSSVPLARRERLALADFGMGAGGSLSVACPKDAALIDQLDDEVLEDRIGMVTSNVSLILQQVKRGQSVMFVPRIFLSGASDRTGLLGLPVQDGLSVKFGLLVPCDFTSNHNVKMLVDYIVEKSSILAR